MNTLPITLIILTICALFVGNFITHDRYIIHSAKAIAKEYSLSHQLFEKVAQTKWKKLEDPTISKNSHEKSEKIVTKPSRKTRFGAHYSQLFLYPYFSAPSKKGLKKYIKRVFKSHYLHSSLFKGNEKALDAWIEGFLARGILSVQEGKELSWQLLLGSDHIGYYLHKGTIGGYSSIEKIFSLEKTSSFLFARSIPIRGLELLFGKELTKKIVEKEKELTQKHPKHAPQTLSESHWRELLPSSHPLLSQMSFKTPRKNKQIAEVFDETERLSLQQSVPNFDLQ